MVRRRGQARVGKGRAGVGSRGRARVRRRGSG
jgi:hypothetical protein